jgi:hypothetical protein
MSRVIKLLLSVLLALALLLAAALAALAGWLSGDGLRLQVQAAASQQWGVPVELEKISLDVWPLPALAVQGLAIQTQPRLFAQRLEARPVWAGLLREPRQLEVLSLHLQGVQLPQRGLDQLQQLLSKKERPAQNPRLPAAQKALKTEPQAGAQSAPLVMLGLLAIPQTIMLDRVTWQSAAGENLTLSGGIELKPARDAAQLDLRLAGGTLRGPVRWSGLERGVANPGAVNRGSVQLRGELTASNLDLAALPGLGVRMSGRLQSTTTLDVQAAKPSDLGAALQTRTTFNVSGAVVKGIDLAKAVRTLGLSRGGETALSTLSGSVITRGSGAAMQVSLTDLQATSSILKASGAVNVGAAANPGAPRPLSGKVSVDLNAPDGGNVITSGAGKALGALVGIPLEIGGTTAAPQVQPTRGALIGGAIGSVLAPVVGTGAGAKIGDKVGEKLSGLKEKLFGR